MTANPAMVASDPRGLYEERLISARAAAGRIASGSEVYVPVGQQPNAILRALLAREDLRDVTITCLPVADLGYFAPEVMARVTLNVLYAGLVTRAPVANGAADFTPFMIYGHHKAREKERPDARRMDVTLIRVSPPNAQGYVCLGNSVWDVKQAIRLSASTIATVSARVPRTYGDSWLHVSEIDWFVEDPEDEAPARPLPPTDPWDEPIARHVATLVQDGDTIQIGTGSTTGNLVRLGAFEERRDLGYFSELTVPGTVDLVRRGIITSRFMSIHPGRFVAATAGNGPEDLAFIDGNPFFEFRAVDYVLDPRVIAANDDYVAINNALAVDLTGQIAASTIGPAVYSGTGGHFSFAMGAFLARRGRYVTVLPATARNGAVSRIVPRFDAGQIVTVPRELADTVVTEYGIAHLLNRSVRDRAEALIAIAHPDFRGELRQRAREYFWGEGA